MDLQAAASLALKGRGIVSPNKGGPKKTNYVQAPDENTAWSGNKVLDSGRQQALQQLVQQKWGTK